MPMKASWSVPVRLCEVLIQEHDKRLFLVVKTGDGQRWTHLIDLQRDKEPTARNAQPFKLKTEEVLRRYRALLAHDRKWLDQFCRPYRASPSRNRRDRVNWPVRDAEYSTRLRAAVEELRHAHPPRCVSTISILFVAGVKQSTRHQLAKLPRCRQVLKDVVESLQEFRRRIKG